jgi:alkylated DNA nucleotide flippase Atl1
MDNEGLPRVVVLDEKAQARWKGKTMAIPSPMEVNDLMAMVPRGKLITIDELRKTIALKHNADIGCPFATKDFSRIVAYATEEDAAGNKKIAIPYWRTLKAKGELNSRYPGGIERQKAYLASEGYKIIQKGKKFLVADYQKNLLTR